MEKKFWKSKTMWGAVLVVSGAVLSAVGYPDLSKIIMGLGASMGLVGLRDAKGKLKFF